MWATPKPRRLCVINQIPLFCRAVFSECSSSYRKEVGTAATASAASVNRPMPSSTRPLPMRARFRCVALPAASATVSAVVKYDSACSCISSVVLGVP
jgi:hypothetical protein